MGHPQKARAHRRYEVHDLHGSLLFRIEVKVLNLSLSGMAVETTQQIKLGKIYSVTLGSAQDSVDVDGVVKWCHLVKTRAGPKGEPVNVYHVGITFDGTLTDKASRLLSFMQGHVVLALQHRIVGRFKLKPGSPVALSTRYDFEVLKLSLSGMLVETRLQPDVDSSFDMELTILGKPFEVAGRIANVRRVGGTDVDPASQLGVQFLELDEAREKVLREFIASELE
jgi:hypothetical protein